MQQSLDSLLLKINTEELLKRVLRYHTFVNKGAPDHIKSSELTLILQSICKAIDMTSVRGVTTNTTNHKDFISEEIVGKWSKFSDERFGEATEESLVQIRYNVYESLLARLNTLNTYADIKKEHEVLDESPNENSLSDLEKLRLKKQMIKDLKELGWLED
jgi:hypothetical protein